MKKIFVLLLCCLLALTMFAACSNSDTPADTPDSAQAAPDASSQTETPDTAEETEEAGDSSSAGGVATAEDMTEVVEVVEEGMVPLYADSLKPGVYPVEMKSSSSMFKADHCELVVEDGKLSAILYMTSSAYPYMYAGTAAAAAAADSAAYIPLAENADGSTTFTLPVDALDAGLEYAAFSKRKELWYDRTLLFRADSLPMDAFADGVITTGESLGLTDGEYTVEVALAGGSGKASVESPASLYVENGVSTARIVWGSDKYDYMIVNGEKYLPVNTEGNSAFVIPVMAFDYNMPVLADTTAMSQPYEIEYTLRFDSSGIRRVGELPADEAFAETGEPAESGEETAPEEAPADGTPAEDTPAVPAEPEESEAPATEEPIPEESVPEEPTPEEPEDNGSEASPYADGTYTIDVGFSGGSGKAHVLSPATLYVKNGSFTARLVWSSSNYDYMKVNGVQYQPITLEGGSTFEIPVSALDTYITVIGDTTAMSQPYEIEYTLYFDSGSMKAVG